MSVNRKRPRHVPVDVAGQKSGARAAARAGVRRGTGARALRRARGPVAAVCAAPHERGPAARGGHRAGDTAASLAASRGDRRSAGPARGCSRSRATWPWTPSGPGKARPHEVGEGALELVSVPDEAERALESWAVADAIRSLRAEHRGVLLETYYHGRSVAEAAAVLGIPGGYRQVADLLRAPRPQAGTGGTGACAMTASDMSRPGLPRDPPAAGRVRGGRHRPGRARHRGRAPVRTARTAGRS